MTNQERRNRIKDLSDIINPLTNEKFMTSLRYNFLKNSNVRDENNDEVKTLTQRLEELTAQLNPLLTEKRRLQVKYIVEYDEELLQNGILTSVSNKREFYLSTNVNIDSYKKTPDYTNVDILTLISEINDTLSQEYSQFTIQHIKRL